MLAVQKTALIFKKYQKTPMLAGVFFVVKICTLKIEITRDRVLS